MSEQRDTFRGRLEALADKVHNEGLPPGQTASDVLWGVLDDYDATAPERERAAKALAVFEGAQLAMQDLMAKGGGCAVCPLETECFEPEYVRCLATDFVAAGIRLGILPAEEAQNGNGD